MGKIDESAADKRDGTHCIRQPSVAVPLGGPVAMTCIHIFLTNSWASFHRLWAAERAKSRTNQ